MDNSNLAHFSVEQVLESAVGNVKRFASESLQQTEKCVRESPGKAVAFSAAIGWVLSFLPICSLIALIVRLMLRLIRPLLLLLSLAKAYELAVASCKRSPANKA
jgi:hypothetical protein